MSFDLRGVKSERCILISQRNRIYIRKRWKRWTMYNYYLLTVMRPSLCPSTMPGRQGTPQTTHYKFYLTIQMKLFKIMSLLGLVGWKQGPQSLSLPTPLHMLHLTYHNNYFHSQAPGYLHQLQLSTRTSTLPCQIPPCPAKVSHDLPYPIQPQ